MSAATPRRPASPAETVLCPRCNEGLECRARTGDCWCNDVMLDGDVRREMAGIYKGCLCPACLRWIEDAHPARQNVREFLGKDLERNRAR